MYLLTLIEHKQRLLCICHSIKANQELLPDISLALACTLNNLMSTKSRDLGNGKFFFSKTFILKVMFSFHYFMRTVDVCAS